MKRSAAQDQRVTQDDEGDPEPEGNQVPQGHSERKDPWETWTGRTSRTNGDKR